MRRRPASLAELLDWPPPTVAPLAPADVDELRAMLGEETAARVAPACAEVLAQTAALEAQLKAAGALRGSDRAACQRVASALRGVLAVWSALPADVARRLPATVRNDVTLARRAWSLPAEAVAPIGAGGPAASRVVADLDPGAPVWLRWWLDATVAMLETATRLGTGPRGRPGQVARRACDAALARVLTAAGVPCESGRTSTLARVLAWADVARGAPVEDVYRRTRAARSAVHETPL